MTILIKSGCSLRILAPLSAALLLVNLVLIRKVREQSREIDRQEHNIEALTATTRLIRNRAGQLEATRQLLITTRDELSDLNRNLSRELEREHGRVQSLIETNLELRADTASVRAEVVRDTVTVPGHDLFEARWSLEDRHAGGYRFLKGITQIDPTHRTGLTTITEDILHLKVISGIRERQGMYEVFARTDYPGVTLDLEGAVFDPNQFAPPKPKRRIYRFYAGSYVSRTENGGYRIGAWTGGAVQIWRLAGFAGLGISQHVEVLTGLGFQLPP